MGHCAPIELDLARVAHQRHETAPSRLRTAWTVTPAPASATPSWVEELRTAGTELVTVADGFALDGPAAEVILAVMACCEDGAPRDQRADRRCAPASRPEGGHWGRPRTMDER